MKKFSIHPMSVLLWIWLCITLGIMSAISYTLAIIIHEFGHFIFAKKLGYKLSKFSISPYGFSLSYQNEDMDYRDDLKIALAGPVANLVTAFLILGLWWLFPVSYFFTECFVKISTMLALINLLPAYPLDGGRIFVACASHIFEVKVAKKITMIFNFMLAIIFLVLFVLFLFLNFNPSYLLFSIFLFVGLLELNFGSKYEKVNVFTKKIKNFVKPEICCVSTDVTVAELLKKIQTTKTKIFCLILENGKIINLSEKLIVKLSVNNFYDKKLGEIFKK